MARRINLKNINVARSNTIRDINRQIILNYVREEGPVSRAYIARVTDLNRSTVSLIVDELLAAELIEEVEGESSGGRPPQLLSLKTTKAVALGVDLGKKMTIIGTSDLTGKILEMQEFSTSPNFDKTMSRIVETARDYIKKSDGSIEGIGISLPGLVESWKGKVVNIPHLGWHYPEIVETIEKATRLPVIVENDTNATALAELWLGRPEISNVRDFVVVLIHSGIGTGIVFDGQIYRGKDGVAGEFGHMTIGTNAPVACAAGSYNCWEAFASERAALARYAKLTGKKNGRNQMIFEELIKLAFTGDKNATKALRETAYYIGLGISNLIQGLSPEVTIVAGKFVQVWSLFADDIIKGAESGVCQGYPAVKIMPSTLGAYPTLMGSFSLILANKFTSLHIN
ncbi:MAG TPA: ROK family transcriptional regulator [Pyrinomonadaceae bacterium]|jgi:predicted NBD/HSP70 family sugar kinase